MLTEEINQHAFVFVTGLHRSGTSPLHRCLRQHPQISGFHDTGVAEDEGQHLQTVLPRGSAYGGPGRFGRHPAVHMTEAHSLANEETAVALFDQWRPYWDLSKPYLLEKTPITLLRTRLLQALFPNSYFVVIVRHPVAVALATYNALASSGTRPDLTIADLMEHWLLCHERFVSDAPHLKRLLVVRYEDFAARPQSTLNAIDAFLGLPTHTPTETIEPDVNARYLSQWNALREDPTQRSKIEQAMRLEASIRAFGYSLEDWKWIKPAANVLASQTDTETGSHSQY